MFFYLKKDLKGNLKCVNKNETVEQNWINLQKIYTWWNNNWTTFLDRIKKLNNRLLYNRIPVWMKYNFKWWRNFYWLKWD